MTRHEKRWQRAGVFATCSAVAVLAFATASLWWVLIDATLGSGCAR